MSKIGKKPIIIPQNSSVVLKDGVLAISGPKGALNIKLHPDIKAEIHDKEMRLVRARSTKQSMALWGTMRALVANAISGTIKEFEKKLEIEGMGYSAKFGAGGEIIFNLGFSHPIVFKIPEGVKITIEKNVLTLSGISKELVGQTAAKIRKLKPPEPYKGKGIRYHGEFIRKKAGKKAVGSSS